jgi:hypothetical protein
MGQPCAFVPPIFDPDVRRPSIMNEKLEQLPPRLPLPLVVDATKSLAPTSRRRHWRQSSQRVLEARFDRFSYFRLLSSAFIEVICWFLARDRRWIERQVQNDDQIITRSVPCRVLAGIAMSNERETHD